MYVNDDDAKPVTAGGVMIYKKVNNNMDILVIESGEKYSDIGGKIDPDDDNIYSAIAREVEEETNGQILAINIIDRLKVANYAYVANSKYVIYIIEANEAERELKKEDFGDSEEHDDIPRNIGWISREELFKQATVKFKMHWRIKNKSLMDQLNEIEKQFKLKTKMFKTNKPKK